MTLRTGHFRLLSMLLVLATGALADEETHLHDLPTWLGFSSKYQQFAVRRQLTFKLTSAGPYDPATALRPGFIAFERDAKGLDTLTCAAFCGQRGFACSKVYPAGFGKNFGGNEVDVTNPTGQWETYATRDCAETLVKSAKAKFAKWPLRGGSCWCDQPGHVFDDLHGKEISFELVEVYSADGKLKRTFLEDTSQAPLLDRLRADLKTVPVEPPVLALLRREFLPAEKWKAHAADGDFQLGTPSAKHPGGECEVEVAMVDNEPCLEGAGTYCFDVEVRVKGPSGKQSVISASSSTREVTFEAHWLPTPKPVLVGVLRWRDDIGAERLKQHDELVVAAAKSCKK